MELDIIKLVSYSPLAIVVYFLYKSGFLGALAAKIRGNSDQVHEKRIHKLETNDIKHLEDDILGIRGDVRRIFDKLEDHGNRLTRVETKINGKL